MAEERRGPPAYLLGLALAAAASGIAVSLLAWAFGFVPLFAAVGGVLLSLSIGFALARPWALDLQEIVVRAGSVGEEDPGPQPVARRTAAGAELARALIESRRRVNRQQRALEVRAITVERVLDAAPEPIFVVDLKGAITHANRSAERAFDDSLVGLQLVDVLRSPELLDAVDNVVEGVEAEATVDIEFADGDGRSYRAVVGRLDDLGEEGEAAVVSLQNLTAIRKLEAMRADFVANASHELRTPLATLIGFIVTMQGVGRDDAKARERFLAIMAEQAGRMQRVVEDLLSLSKIELEEFSPPGLTDRPGDVLSAVADQLAPVAAAADVKVAFDVPPDLPASAGGPELLQQVFRNLLENAIKYGGEGSTVRVEAETLANGLRVSFIDEGEGVPAEHIPRLTERFYRVDVARSRTLGGTGLGLAIVKHILIRCHGRLNIESEVGEGSNFSVFLPSPRVD